MPTVAFQGVEGAFSEEAAQRFWTESVKTVPQVTFSDVFQAVEEGQCAYGIIPVENSRTGSIHRNIDLLLEHDLSVVGEIDLRICHCLLILPQGSLSSIRTVYSHPQALEQCTSYLSRMQNVKLVPYFDTAGSAKHIASQSQSEWACIASERAASVYNLKVLADNIADDPDNTTRFLIISTLSNNRPEDGKTSIIFGVPDYAGALSKCLSIFAERNINLLKIESRPDPKSSWSNWFYLEVSATMNDNRCSEAICELGKQTTFLKVLGSYRQVKAG